MHRTTALLVIALVPSTACTVNADGGASTTSSLTADGTASGAGGGGSSTLASSGTGLGCGDGACNAGEDCTTCPTDCGTCAPIPCPHEGGLFCGGDGVGGDPQVLYVCHEGVLQVQEECGADCEYMPLGVPDQCPGDIVVPASLLDTLDSTPYVEQDCVPTTYPGWPYEALECTYSAEGETATVKVADAPPERVGRWIVDSASLIPALAALQADDPGAWEDGLHAIGYAMMLQSSRIFPLSGGIIEDMGGGAVVYDFEKGVTTTCSSGCYCRINSLHRTEWCSYRASLGDDYDTCIAGVGDANYTEGWGGECLGNHLAAWASDRNEHFRAKAFVANQQVSAECPPSECSPTEVVDSVKSAYGL